MVLDKLSSLPKNITQKDLEYSQRLHGVESDDILCIASSRALIFSECAITYLSNEQVIDFSVLTGHKQLIAELEDRALLKDVEIEKYNLIEFYPPKFLLRKLQSLAE